MLLEKYFTIVGILAARYVIIAGGYYFTTWVAFKNRLMGFLVNSQSVFRGQIGFELKYALLTTFIFGLGGLNFYIAKEKNLGLVYLDVATYGWSYFYLSIFLMVLINDVYFYWTHRMLHLKPLFSRYHVIHHRSRVTTPLTSQSFHAFETVINVLVAVAFPFMFPIHPKAYLVFTFIAFINNVYGHGNYDWIREPLRSKFPFNLLNSPTVHGFHHSNVHGNYGLYTNIWDRLHGTYINPCPAESTSQSDVELLDIPSPAGRFQQQPVDTTNI